VIDLSGKVALVTGGARGIGAACARLLATAGADVGIGYRSRDDEAQHVLQDITSLGRVGFTHKGDLSTRAANDAFVQEAVARFGRVDIFVGNAGIWPDIPIAVGDLEDARWHRTISTNLDGMFFGARAAIRHMPSGGRLIFISSTAGQRGEAGHADYAATKGAMIAFVKSMAVEVGGRNITVNSVAPGWVDTDAVTTPFAGEGRGRIEANIPVGRVASPEDIAGPVVFLASPLARHVTGEILNVNGGSVLCG
jgi:3-oxoacyl-[acyl-carrier protein] reductase